MSRFRCALVAVAALMLLPAAPAAATPTADIEPLEHDFGAWQVGETWFWLFRIGNDGTTPLEVSAIAITGPDAGEFWSDPAGCQPQIQPGDFCLLNVSFTPTSPGVKTATLQITDNAPGSPHTASLRGTGTGTQTVTTIQATPDPVVAGGAMTWTASVAPNPGGGTVDFVLDGFESVVGCQDVPLRADGTATCATTAPRDPGVHFARASFSGFATFLPSIDDEPFAVRSAPGPAPAPAPSAPPSGTPNPAGGDGGSGGGGDAGSGGDGAGERIRGASVVAPVRLSRRGRGVLRVRCPAGRDCTVAGAVRARRAPGATPAGPRVVLARFAGVDIPAGRSRRVPFTVPRAWLADAQRRGVRRTRALVAVRTTHPGGGQWTNRQLVALSLPRA